MSFLHTYHHHHTYHNSNNNPNSSCKSLWMGDINDQMDENFIKEAFNLMGENAVSVKIIKNKSTGVPVGYGFITFGDEATTIRVLYNCNGKQIPNANDGRRFKLNTAGRSTESSVEHSLFVGDLSHDVDDLKLLNAFSAKYPSVKGAKVILNASGESRGYGFVKFANESEYKSALRDCNARRFVGNRPIRVSPAYPRTRPQLQDNHRSQSSRSSNIVLTDSNDGEYPGECLQQPEFNNNLAHCYPNYANCLNYDMTQYPYYVYPGGRYWDGYQCYDPQQYYGPDYMSLAAAAAAAQSSVSSASIPSSANMSDAIDVDKLNQAAVSKNNDDLCRNLQDSRWFPVSYGS